MAWGHVPGPGGWYFYIFGGENRSVLICARRMPHLVLLENKIEKDYSLAELQKSHGGQIK